MKSGVSNDGAHLARDGPVLLPEEIQTKLKHHGVLNPRSIAHLGRISVTKQVCGEQANARRRGKNIEPCGLIVSPILSNERNTGVSDQATA